jgi:nucleoside-triphosphatase THEP1
MNTMAITIFSAPVHSGKTTALQQWCTMQKDISGILMPDINGSRKIFDIGTGDIFDLECSDPGNSNAALVNIGRFFFYEDVFQKANNMLLNMLKPGPGWLVIDEVGKLELAEKGFYPAVKKITETYQNDKRYGNLLLVVRDSLCEEVIRFFSLKDAQVVKSLI